MTFKSRFQLGDVLRDRLTGIEGTCTVIAAYLSGCIHCGIQPKAKKGETKDPAWIWQDENRFEFVKRGPLSMGNTGGPEPKGPSL